MVTARGFGGGDTVHDERHVLVDGGVSIVCGKGDMDNDGLDRICIVGDERYGAWPGKTAVGPAGTFIMDDFTIWDVTQIFMEVYHGYR